MQHQAIDTALRGGYSRVMSEPAHSPPNIIVIMSDEHDAAVTGCYGDRLVQTPHLDGLASRGVTFDNCYTNSPLCAPCRLSFTAGQYISRCGAWNNNCRLPSDDYPSLPRAMQAAGYDTYLCGKQHYDRTRRYGWTDLTPDIHSNLYDKRGRGGRRSADDQSVGAKGWEGRSSQFYPADESSILNHDREVTATASRFLADRGDDDTPFMLFVGYLAPHFPLIAPGAIYQRYKGKVPMPDIPEGGLDRLPLNYKHLRWGFGAVNATPEQVQLGRDLYWALTEWFDGEVGKVLDALNGSGVADNTVVIYTSDHGENKGDHGMWWKNCMYDHGARVPLIVSDPRHTTQHGTRRSQVCSLVDVVQTLAELGGAQPGERWDGDSLLPVLGDGTAAWKDTALSEYYAHNIASGFTMWRDGDWKYVYHARMDDAHGPERELYHMTSDPGEWRNRAGDPEQAERVTTMHAAMVAELGEEPDAIELRCRADFARGYDND